ncbi:MAG: thioesterase family protein [Saprospiraceae bacterium]|nr:thioesterase family protein [Saprospiraceae bacterium]
MYTHETTVRVRYSETDQMGFVYYGHYAAYFEVARVEAMRQLGIRYASLEVDHGILMPVMNMHVRFLRPAGYDALLTIRTAIPSMPDDRITFHSEIFLENNKLCTAGRVTLCFLEAATRKRVTVPLFLIDTLKPYFETA